MDVDFFELDLCTPKLWAGLGLLFWKFEGGPRFLFMMANIKFDVNDTLASNLAKFFVFSMHFYLHPVPQLTGCNSERAGHATIPCLWAGTGLNI